MLLYYIVGIFVFVIGGLGWSTYFKVKGEWIAYFVALVGGGLSIFVALKGYEGFAQLGHSVEWTDLHGDWGRAIGYSLIIGFVEEAAKILPVVAIYWVLGRYLRSSFYGIVFAGLSGIGFATAESIALLFRGELTLSKILARAMVGPLVHALFAVPAGYGYWISYSKNKLYPVFLGLGVSIVTHAAYDLLIAKSDGQMFLGSTCIVLALWAWMVRFTTFKDRHGQI
jgi:RsiW-degrading membrane proteinase PrsW (M82 family)